MNHKILINNLRLNDSQFVMTLALGLRLRQGLAKVQTEKKT